MITKVRLHLVEELIPYFPEWPRDVVARANSGISAKIKQTIIKLPGRPQRGELLDLLTFRADFGLNDLESEYLADCNYQVKIRKVVHCKGFRIRPSKYILQAVFWHWNFAGNKDMKKAIRETKRSRLDASSWMLLLEAHSESELSIKDFCAVQGISEASFYQWRKRLQVDKGSDSVMFSPIEIQSKSIGSIVVELPGGVFIRFAELPPVEYLRSLSSMFSGIVL